MRATRDQEGTYAFVYLPAGKPVELNLSPLYGEQLAVSWYDPRTGIADSDGIVQKGTNVTFAPPAGGPDWVLVLDDVARTYPRPGTVSYH